MSSSDALSLATGVGNVGVVFEVASRAPATTFETVGVSVISLFLSNGGEQLQREARTSRTEAASISRNGTPFGSGTRMSKPSNISQKWSGSSGALSPLPPLSYDSDYEIIFYAWKRLVALGAWNILAYFIIYTS
jgi:hypothetical protein